MDRVTDCISFMSIVVDNDRVIIHNRNSKNVITTNFSTVDNRNYLDCR